MRDVFEVGTYASSLLYIRLDISKTWQRHRQPAKHLSTPRIQKAIIGRRKPLALVQNFCPPWQDIKPDFFLGPSYDFWLSPSSHLFYLPRYFR